MAKKKTKTPTNKEEPKRPEVKPEELLLVMSNDEVYSLIQILAFSKDVFKQMSLNCAVEGDTKAEAAYAARSELSGLLFNKLRTMANIGEPTSRALH